MPHITSHTLHPTYYIPHITSHILHPTCIQQNEETDKTQTQPEMNQSLVKHLPADTAL